MWPFPGLFTVSFVLTSLQLTGQVRSIEDVSSPNMAQNYSEFNNSVK